VGGQEADQGVELHDAGAVGQIGRHSEIVTVSQGVIHEAGEVSPRAHLDEDSRSVIIHRLDGFTKAYSSGPLIERELPNLDWVPGVECGRDAGINWGVRSHDPEALKEMEKLVANGLKQGGVVGPLKRQKAADGSLILQTIAGSCDGPISPAKDYLVWTIIHRQVQPSATFLQYRCHYRGVRRTHRHQRCRRDLIIQTLVEGIQFESMVKELLFVPDFQDTRCE
jgi:hypothetical protein